MDRGTVDVIVAGLVCLDIVPTFRVSDGAATGRGATSLGGTPGSQPRPGDLVVVGRAVVATGGAVSNTGIALHRLGLRVLLVGRVGSDEFGAIVRDRLRRECGDAAAIGVDPAGTTSYSIVVSPPGVDRTFFHCPGANDEFDGTDVTDDMLDRASALHLGYPPVMRRLFAEDGCALEALVRRARDRGVRTSLDMAVADAASESAHASWERILRRTLPHVDAFVPSWDDMVFALGVPEHPTGRGDLADLASTLLGWGAAVVVLKLGEQGVYVRTRDRELLAPCFRVDVAGTTGAGDATAAGFLAGWLRGASLEESATLAVAVGACCVEATDSTSGIRDLATVRTRIAAGWPRLEPTIDLGGWTWDSDTLLYVGPDDRTSRRA